MLNIFLGDLAISVDISTKASARNQSNGEHLRLQLEEEDLARRSGIDDVVKRARGECCDLIRRN